MPMGVWEKNVFMEVLGKERRSFCRAAWTEATAFAGERNKLRMIAVFALSSSTTVAKHAAV